MAPILSCNLPALIHSFLKILLHILHSLASVEQHIIFKVQVQAAKIQVGSADHGQFSITYTLLSMEKTRCIFKYPHTLVHQAGIL